MADALLAVLGIIAGTLLASFSQLSVWRQALDECQSDDKAHGPDRWLVNAAVAHVSAAAASAILACMFYILAMFVGPDDEHPCSIFCQFILACGITFTSHTLITVLIVISDLYAVYVQVNKVSAVQNGNDFTN